MFARAYFQIKPFRAVNGQPAGDDHFLALNRLNKWHIESEEVKNKLCYRILNKDNEESWKHKHIFEMVLIVKTCDTHSQT